MILKFLNSKAIYCLNDTPSETVVLCSVVYSLNNNTRGICCGGDETETVVNALGGDTNPR